MKCNLKSKCVRFGGILVKLISPSVHPHVFTPAVPSCSNFSCLIAEVNIYTNVLLPSKPKRKL